MIDAALFLPHSRPRLFIVGVRDDLKIHADLLCNQPQEPFHTPAVTTAFERLSPDDKAAWLWWYIPTPPRRQSNFADLIEENVCWNSEAQTAALLGLMSPVNLAKVKAAQQLRSPMVGTIYKRTRVSPTGDKAQRAEIRFDDLAGCLRTPGGGSSRQSILVVKGNKVRSRLLSPREAARLMGVPDNYVLPDNYNDAYHLMGDGVAVPVVGHISNYILEPLLKEIARTTVHAA